MKALQIFAQRAVADAPQHVRDGVLKSAAGGYDAMCFDCTDPDVLPDVTACIQRLLLRAKDYAVVDALLATELWTATDFYRMAYRYADSPWDDAVDAWLAGARCCRPDESTYSLYEWLKKEAHDRQARGDRSGAEFAWRIWKAAGDHMADAFPKATPAQVEAYKRSQR